MSKVCCRYYDMTIIHGFDPPPISIQRVLTVVLDSELCCVGIKTFQKRN